jgi:hypothetical protein
MPKQKTFDVKIGVKFRGVSSRNFDVQSFASSTFFGNSNLNVNATYSGGSAEVSEFLVKRKRDRKLLTDFSRIKRTENKVLNKAREWSSGGITLQYLRRYRPYARRRPQIPSSYWHIINDHSNDPTAGASYRGRQFKRGWRVYSNVFGAKSNNPKSVFVIENVAPYSLFIRASEYGRTKMVERPIFSRLLEYARKIR